MATKMKVIYRDNFLGIKKKNLETIVGKKFEVDELLKICKRLATSVTLNTKDLLTRAIQTKDYSELENFNVTNKIELDLYYNIGIKNVIVEIVQDNFDKVVVPKEVVELFKPILYHYIIQELSNQ
jgi:hypothetical protein